MLLTVLAVPWQCVCVCVCVCVYVYIYIYIYIHTHTHTHTHTHIYRVSQEECARLRESAPYDNYTDITQNIYIQS